MQGDFIFFGDRNCPCGTGFFTCYCIRNITRIDRSITQYSLWQLCMTGNSYAEGLVVSVEIVSIFY